MPLRRESVFDVVFVVHVCLRRVLVARIRAGMRTRVDVAIVEKTVLL